MINSIVAKYIEPHLNQKLVEMIGWDGEIRQNRIVKKD